MKQNTKAKAEAMQSPLNPEDGPSSRMRYLVSDSPVLLCCNR